MDRVRLGRALGYGTRHAAKTVAAVVEAAGAPATAGTPRETARQPEPLIGTTPAGAQRQRRYDSAERIGGGLSHLKRSVWQPLADFSGALWLRVTGLFFGLIAFTVSAGAWRLHANLRNGFLSPLAIRFWLFLGVAAGFAYFAISSFARANRKERRASKPSHGNRSRKIKP